MFIGLSLMPLDPTRQPPQRDESLSGPGTVELVSFLGSLLYVRLDLCPEEGQHVDHASAALQRLPSGISVECCRLSNTG
jgi:hypothetical protein